MLSPVQKELEKNAINYGFWVDHPQSFITDTNVFDKLENFEPVSFGLGENELCYLTFKNEHGIKLQLNTTEIYPNEIGKFNNLISLIDKFTWDYKLYLNKEKSNA